MHPDGTLNTGQGAGPGREENISVRAACTVMCVYTVTNVNVLVMGRERENTGVILKFQAV